MDSLHYTLTSWLANAGWIDAAEAFFVAMSIVGQHFIARRQAKGFYFWIAGNVVALVLFSSLGRWMTVALYVYFLWKSIEGVRVWRVLEGGEAPGPKATSPA